MKTPKFKTYFIGSVSLATYGLTTLILLPTTSFAKAKEEISQENAETKARVAEKLKEKKEIIEKVTDGTVMREGVVYAKASPLGPVELARVFLREGRPARTQAEINELAQGLKTGAPDAIRNFRRFMEDYLENGTIAPAVVDSLNDAVINPNPYKLNSDFAKGLLREAFEEFVTLNGDERPSVDFSEVDLDGFYITGKDLRKTGLTGNELAEFSDWSETRVDGLDLKGVDFREKTLNGTIFNEADLSDAKFNDSDLSTTSFKKATLERTDFGGANISETNFSKAKLNNANLRNTTGFRTNFSGAILDDADVADAQLEQPELGGTNIDRVKNAAPTTFVQPTYTVVTNEDC